MTWVIGGNGLTEPGWDTAWANWATNWVPQFARHSSRKPVLRQALEMVAGVRFELTTFGLSIDVTQCCSCLDLLEPRLNVAAGAADVSRAMLLTSCSKVTLLTAIFAFL